MFLSKGAGQSAAVYFTVMFFLYLLFRVNTYSVCNVLLVYCLPVCFSCSLLTTQNIGNVLLGLIVFYLILGYTLMFTHHGISSISYKGVSDAVLYSFPYVLSC